jgi:hypothetical protein
MTEIRAGSPTSSSSTHPTVGEALARVWEGLPSLSKALVTAISALLIVLVPANLFITAQFFAISTETLRAQHQKHLSELSDSFDQLIAAQSQALRELAASSAVQACSATGCQADAEAVFGATLRTKIGTSALYYTELGWIGLDGQQGARAVRGIGGSVETSGGAPLVTADEATLATLNADEPFVFPITRDARITSNDAYQMPALRMAMPVTNAATRHGYLTSVLNLDDFFAQQFVYSSDYELLLLDRAACVVASSDDTRRSELAKTWAGDPNRTCYTDLPLQEWDVTTQRLDGQVFSSKVMHGALTPSGQAWTLLIRQPYAVAYAQANTLQALLTAAHVLTGLVVAALMILGDRATKRLMKVEQARLAAHARDARYNPFSFALPIDDAKRFYGRTRLLAQVIGVGVMGGNNVILSGDPQAGKTSFLRRIEQRLRDQQIKDPQYYYWPIWMDVQGVPPDLFYRLLMESILKRVENHQTRTDLRYHQAPPTYGVRQFREDVNEIVALPDGGQKEKRLVLCLDNLHYWFSQEDDSSGFTPTFRDDFRDVFNDVGTQLRVIATGTNIPRNAFGALDSYFALGPLDPDEARRLIRQPLADYYEVEDTALDQLLLYSDRLPAALQRLGHHAVQIMLAQDANTVTVAHADRAVDQALADWEPVYRSLWYGGPSPAQTTLTPLKDEERAALKNALNYNGVVAVLSKPASRFAGAVYTDPDGMLRLTRLFSTWLKRLP